MSSSSRRPWRSHNSSRTIRAIIKNGSNNADASGGLLIELWWWVANWFAILGCWVFFLMGLVSVVGVWVVITLLASWFRERERDREEEEESKK